MEGKNNKITTITLCTYVSLLNDWHMYNVIANKGYSLLSTVTLLHASHLEYVNFPTCTFHTNHHLSNHCRHSLHRPLSKYLI